MGEHDAMRDAATNADSAAAPIPRSAAGAPQLEALFEALLEGAPDAMIIVDAAGRIQIANRQAELLFGYPVDELLGQPIELLLPASLGERHVRHRTSYVAMPHTRPMGSGLDLVARRRDGSTFAVEVSLSALQTAAGLLVTSVVRDVSERKRAAEELQRQMAARVSTAEAGMMQAARLAAVGQLAASIAHEINNPLYAARNSLYLLEGDLPPESSGGPYLAIARDELARIAGIIERMRDFYRPPRGDQTPCDLNRLVEETLAITSLNTRHTAIQLLFLPDATLAPVLGNGDQLRQVLLNLLLNAVDAMPEGGTLSVRTLAGSSVALLEISDSGVGIPDDVRAHLFEPFFTTKPTGTGLGLSISAHIVTQHHGQIEVDSAPGEGTTFRVALPYKPPT
jgi:PAS domain S-box-containing protein